MPEIGLYPSKCIGVDLCGQCIEACPFTLQNVIERENGRVGRINRQICDNCLKCANACPSGAFSAYGRRMTVSQVLDTVLADREYYQENGGVTFSGGEAFMQIHFLKECLSASQYHGIHTCVESALNIPAMHLIQTLPLIDLIIFDIKVMDTAKHTHLTGRSNRRILENATLIAETNQPMIIRIPVVPGYNDDQENITATARFIRERLGHNVRQVQLLRYRPLGEEKYASLGMEYPMAGMTFPSRAYVEDRIVRLAREMADMGVPAVAGTTTAF